jgi:hypothetical protein
MDTPDAQPPADNGTRTYGLTDAAVDALKREMVSLWVVQSFAMIILGGVNGFNISNAQQRDGSELLAVEVWGLWVPYDVLFWVLVLLPIVIPLIVVPLAYRRRRRALATFRLIIEPDQITMQSRPGSTKRVRREDVMSFTPFEPDQPATQGVVQIFATGQTITIPATIEPEGFADLRQTLATWQGKSRTQDSL